jgi:ATP-dependent Clp protease adaptor protein ClpS
MATKTNSDTSVMEKQKAATKPQQPPQFKVVLLNDDFTPFDFVITVLTEVFRKSVDEAEALAVQIHLDGKGLCGVYVKDIAEQKQSKVMMAARQDGHPLQCVLEPETPAPSNSRGMKP